MPHSFWSCSPLSSLNSVFFVCVVERGRNWNSFLYLCFSRVSCLLNGYHTSSVVVFEEDSIKIGNHKQKGEINRRLDNHYRSPWWRAHKHCARLSTEVPNHGQCAHTHELKSIIKPHKTMLDLLSRLHFSWFMLFCHGAPCVLESYIDELTGGSVARFLRVQSVQWGYFQLAVAQTGVFWNEWGNYCHNDALW